MLGKINCIHNYTTIHDFQLWVKLINFSELVTAFELSIENEEYLRSHPEIGKLIQDFVESFLTEKPSNVNSFAASYFTQLDLKQKLSLK